MAKQTGPNNKNEKNLHVIDRFKQHWFISIFALCVVAAIGAWCLAEKLLVAPRDFEINRLEKELSGLQASSRNSSTESQKGSYKTSSETSTSTVQPEKDHGFLIMHKGQLIIRVLYNEEPQIIDKYWVEATGMVDATPLSPPDSSLTASVGNAPETTVNCHIQGRRWLAEPNRDPVVENGFELEVNGVTVPDSYVVISRGDDKILHANYLIKLMRY